MTKQKTEIDRIHFLYGPEAYLIEEEIQKLLDHTLSRKEKGLNLHLFSGEEHSSQDIVQAAQTLPMFSQYRFVLVSEADEFDDDTMKALLEYIRNPSPSTCLVMYAQTLGPWRKYRSEIEKVGRVVEFSRLKGKALVSWIRKRMVEKGKTLSEDAAGYLVEVVGDHLHDLQNAVEKAFLCVGSKEAIELSDMEGITSGVKISTVFDLMDAIGHQNLEKALRILEKAMEAKTIPFRKDEETSRRMNDPIPLLLSMMARQYRNIRMVKQMTSQHQGGSEIAKVLNMSLWNVKKLLEQGKYFSDTSLREGILKCYQTDLSIKKGRGPKDLLMEKLVIDLSRPH